MPIPLMPVLAQLEEAVRCWLDGDSAHLPYRLGERDRGAHAEVQAARLGADRDAQLVIGDGAHRIRDAGRFAAEHQHVALPESELGIGRRGSGGEQDKPPAFPFAPLLERIEISVFADRRDLQIVHAGALERPVGKLETDRMDDVDGRRKTGGEAQDRAGVARDFRLIECDVQIVIHVVGKPIQRLRKLIQRMSPSWTIARWPIGAGVFATNSLEGRSRQLEPTEGAMDQIICFAPARLMRRAYA